MGWRARHIAPEIIRGWALFSGFAYLAIVAAVGVIVASEGIGQVPVAFLLLVVPAAGAVLFLRGASTWDGATSRRDRLLGWIAMLCGLVPLVSFAFLIVPWLVPAGISVGRWPRAAEDTAPQA